MNEQSITKFLQAIGERRFDDLDTMLAPDPALRWITPGGVGEKTGTTEVVDKYRTWFGWLTQVDVLSTHSETLGNRFLFAYQFRVQKPDGDWRTVRQQGVLDAGDAGITAIDLVCTGFVAE